MTNELKEIVKKLYRKSHTSKEYITKNYTHTSPVEIKATEHSLHQQSTIKSTTIIAPASEKVIGRLNEAKVLYEINQNFIHKLKLEDLEQYAGWITQNGRITGLKHGIFQLDDLRKTITYNPHDKVVATFHTHPFTLVDGFFGYKPKILGDDENFYKGICGIDKNIAHYIIVEDGYFKWFKGKISRHYFTRKHKQISELATPLLNEVRTLEEGGWDLVSSLSFRRGTLNPEEDVIHAHHGKIYAISRQRVINSILHIKALEINPAIKQHGSRLAVMKELTYRAFHNNINEIAIASLNEKEYVFYRAIEMKLLNENTFKGDRKWMQKFLKK